MAEPDFLDGIIEETYAEVNPDKVNQVIGDITAQPASMYEQIQGMAKTLKPLGGPFQFLLENTDSVINSISDIGAGVGALAGGGLMSIPAAGAGATIGAGVEDQIRQFIGAPPEEQLMGLAEDPTINDALNTFGIDLLGGGLGKLGSKVASKVGEKVVKPMLANFPEADRVLTQGKEELSGLIGRDVSKLSAEESARRGTFIKGQLKQVSDLATKRAEKREAPLLILNEQEKQISNALKEARKAKVDPIYPTQRQTNIDYLEKQLAEVSKARKEFESIPLEVSDQDKAVTSQMLEPLLKDKAAAKDVAKDIVGKHETVELALQATNGRVKPLLQDEIFSQMIDSKSPAAFARENKRTMEILLPGKTAQARTEAYDNLTKFLDEVEKPGAKGRIKPVEIQGGTTKFGLSNNIGQHGLAFMTGYFGTGGGLAGVAGGIVLSMGTDKVMKIMAANPKVAKTMIKMAEGAEDISKAEFKNFLAATAGTKITIQGANGKKKSGVIEMNPTLKNYNSGAF